MIGGAPNSFDCRLRSTVSNRPLSCASEEEEWLDEEEEEVWNEVFSCSCEGEFSFTL